MNPRLFSFSKVMVIRVLQSVGVDIIPLRGPGMNPGPFVFLHGNDYQTCEFVFVIVLTFKMQCRHFQLKWAPVESSTCIRAGERFCVCSQELFSWVSMPLEILYANNYEVSNGTQPSPSYSPASLASKRKGILEYEISALSFQRSIITTT